MRFRNQMLLFFMLTASAVILLWLLPGPRTTISSEGIKHTNQYWLWLAGAVFVAVGCALEYFWMSGFALVDKHLSLRKKQIVGAALFLIAALGFSYGLYQYYYP